MRQKALAAELEIKQVMVKIKAGEGGRTFAPYLQGDRSCLQGAAWH